MGLDVLLPLVADMLKLHSSFLLLFAVAICSGESATASPTSDRRLREAKESLAAFQKEKRELRANEVLLYSISPPLSEKEFLAVMDTGGVRLSAVHSCPPQGGAAAFFIDPDERLAPQFEIIRRQSLPQVAAIAKKNSLFAAPSNAESMEFTLCGFEAKVSQAAMSMLSARLGNRIVATEVIKGNHRKLPLNKSDYQ